MSNTKNNHQALKKSKTLEELHEMFFQWLTTLLRDERGRSVIRTMVDEHELPVIDDAAGRMAGP